MNKENTPILVANTDDKWFIRYDEAECFRWRGLGLFWNAENYKKKTKKGFKELLKAGAEQEF